MKSYRKLGKSSLFAVLILSFFLFASPAFAQYFTIERFHSDITVYPESSFFVKETIEVNFDRPRHGIYREIPFRYRDELGKTVMTSLKVLAVEDGAGKPRRYQAKRTGSVINIRIGDPKQFVKGDQTYVIHYKVENAVLFLDDHDELYWNVTGNDWKAPIRNASAAVHLSVKGISKDLWLAGYEGHFGSREEAGYETYENGGKFIARRSLHAGEGLTIAFGWDKGLVSPPSPWKRFLWAIDIGENWIFLLPFFSLILMAARWYRKGRDPRVRESVTVMYEPPRFDDRPLIPAEVGALLDEKLDPRDITSTIIGLAVKGYITIEETKREGLFLDKTDYELTKLKEPDTNLHPFEIELMKNLFSVSPSGIRLLLSSLKNKFYTHLPGLKKALYGELVRKKYFPSNPERVRNAYMIAAILIVFFGIFALAFLTPHSMAKGLVALGCTGFFVLIFGRAMPAKTRVGATAYMDILGFQEFMNRAERDRLKRMGDKNLFSKFLPYAIALDVADNWARAFEGIYQDPPNWYVSPGGFRTFHPTGFARSINAVTSTLGSAIFSAPRGSGGGGRGGGFGGGGSSGGGFGGGGGGSW